MRGRRGEGHDGVVTVEGSSIPSRLGIARLRVGIKSGLGLGIYTSKVWGM